MAERRPRNAVYEIPHRLAGCRLLTQMTIQWVQFSSLKYTSIYFFYFYVSGSRWAYCYYCTPVRCIRREAILKSSFISLSAKSSWHFTVLQKRIEYIESRDPLVLGPLSERGVFSAGVFIVANLFGEPTLLWFPRGALAEWLLQSYCASEIGSDNKIFRCIAWINQFKFFYRTSKFGRH